ncbi:hypothetical protein BKA61DRAFT_361641 [Leptodontidium sp. MPI-SDFR-AT-0119]|nr:hypothetical protein BKA61DRAFT_361641 [Leptodontidium sp. MPI-SDFR-AT-0119]
MSLGEEIRNAEEVGIQTVCEEYMASLERAAHTSATYLTGQWALGAFLQTIIIDPFKCKDYSQVYMNRRRTLESHGRPSPLRSILVPGQVLLFHRFFVTRKDYFGLGPSTTAVGDKVFVLFGCATPYLLRSEGDHHVVVGWCYLHGAMVGEAIHQMNNGELKEEEILLSKVAQK